MNLSGISDAEMEIMQIIWEREGRVFLSPLMENLEKIGKTWKSNTVQTFLTRLVDKGLLTIKKQGRMNEYVACLSEKEYMDQLNQSFLGKFYGGKAKSLVSALLRQDCLSTDDIEELKSFWEEKREKNE